MIRQFQRLVARFGRRAHFAFEWPRTNDGWNTAPVRALRKILNIECNFDGCRYGLRTTRDEPILKKWRVITNWGGFRSHLDKKCAGAHAHTPNIGGQELKRTELYTRPLANAVVKALMTRKHLPHEALPVDQDQEAVPPVPDAETLRAIRHLHTNMAHPSNRALARAIRLSGGSDAAVKAALHFTCSVCHRLQIPRPVAPARLREHWKEFADCVAIDLLELTDVNGTRATFINCLDMASRFQIVSRVQSKHPLTVFQAFMHHWCMWAGPPVTILTDL